MVVNAKLDLSKAFLADLAYYPGDIVKNVLAVTVALALHKAFPDLLVRRVRPLAPPAAASQAVGSPAAASPEAASPTTATSATAASGQQPPTQP
jgi:biotin transport system substrate-specific component